jgi:predicted Zn finger-like uncharacterized protein
VPITRCPNCRTELEIDADDFGYRVQCPSCNSAFTPEKDDAPLPASPPPPPPPPPPPAPTPAPADADDGTQVVTCPECNGQVGVLKEDLGHDMRCPLCDKVFTARLDDGRRSSRRGDDGDRSPPWRSRSRSGDDDKSDDRGGSRRSRYDDDDDDDDRPRGRRRRRYDDDDTPEDLVRYAQRECSASGIGLIVIACLGFLGGLLILVMYGIILAGGLPGIRGGAGGGGGIDDAQIFLNMGMGVLQLVVSAFLLYAGAQLRQAKQYAMGMVACIICMVPYFSPCCLLGLVFGIMGIVKLSDARVKKGFEANKPEYQGDGYR